MQVNSTPNDPDEQEMPKKLRLLIKAKNNYLTQQKEINKYDEVTTDNNFDSYKDVDDRNLLDSTKHMG